MKFVIQLFFVLLCYVGFSPTWSQTDTSKVFSYRDFYELVVKNHPVLRQANNLSDQAQAELLMAKGAFDPKLEVNAGFERNVGDVLGTDIRTPIDGLSYIGLTFPVLQRFVIDERRATLQSARLFQNMADVERVKLVNKLIKRMKKLR